MNQGSGLRSLRGHPVTIAPGQRCPYCHEGLDEQQHLMGCPDCLVTLHYLCAPDGRCTTLGCPNGPRRARISTLRSAPPPRGRWRALRLKPRWSRILLCLALFGAGFGLTYAPEVVEPPVVVHPQPQLANISATLDGQARDLRNGLAEVRGVVRIADPDVELRWRRGEHPGQPQVWVDGQPARVDAWPGGNAQIALVGFTAWVPALRGAGWHDLTVSWSWGRQSGAMQARAFQPAVRPEPVPPPVVTNLVVPQRVDSDLLIVEGVVTQGPADVTISGPMGEVPLAQLPAGPFTGAVTLPGPGAHAIVVTIRGPDGRTQVQRAQVVR